MNWGEFKLLHSPNVYKVAESITKPGDRCAHFNTVHFRR